MPVNLDLLASRRPPVSAAPLRASVEIVVKASDRSLGFARLEVRGLSKEEGRTLRAPLDAALEAHRSVKGYQAKVSGQLADAAALAPLRGQAAEKVAAAAALEEVGEEMLTAARAVVSAGLSGFAAGELTRGGAAVLYARTPAGALTDEIWEALDILGPKFLADLCFAILAVSAGLPWATAEEQWAKEEKAKGNGAEVAAPRPLPPGGPS